MTSVLLIDEDDVNRPISYDIINKASFPNNDRKVYDLLESSIKSAVEISQNTSLPISMRKCGCPLLKDNETTCISYSTYEIIGIFESTRKLSCGKHLRQVLKSFTFPGLTIIYQGRFRVEINTPMPYYYPSHEEFVKRMNVFIESNSLQVPSFDLYDVLKKLLECKKYKTEDTDYVLLKKISSESSNKDICCICHEFMDNINSGSLIKCNHIFHVHCLQKLVNSKIYTCPLCRCEIEVENIVKN